MTNLRADDAHFAQDKPARGGNRDEPPERKTIARNEQFDDPSDPLVRPAEPRCRHYGQPFSTERELAEHAKTCKGGHSPRPRTHSSR